MIPGKRSRQKLRIELKKPRLEVGHKITFIKIQASDKYKYPLQYCLHFQ